MAVVYDAQTDTVYRIANLPASLVAMTMLAWVKWVTDNNALQLVLSSKIAAGGDRNNFSIDTASTNTRGRLSNSTTTVTVGGATAITIDTWFYYAMTSNGTNLIGYIYNEAGTLVGSDSSLAANAGTPAFVTYGNLANLATSGLIGKLCYMRCFDANLSQAEIEAERTHAKGARTANLLWNWKELTDDSGNGYDPTAVGVTTDSDFPSAVLTGPPLPVFLNQFRQRRE